MARFIPKMKLSKKARKELNSQRRVTWDFSPVTKTVESKKLYNRKKNSHVRNEDDGMGVFHNRNGCPFGRNLQLPVRRIFDKINI